MNTILSRIQDQHRALLIVLALGLIFRTLFISLHERPLISDEKEYSQLAFKLATTGTYTYDLDPTAYRPVGYPLFAGVIYFLVGHHPLAVKFFQAILDVATAYFIYLLLAGFPERTRVLGAACWAFFAPAVFYSNLILSETVFTFSLTLMALILLRTNALSLRRSLVLGLLCGFIMLIKPSAMLLIVALAFLWFTSNVRSKLLVALLVGWAIATSPWLLRNYATFGEFALSSNGGINLLIGNNPGSTGAYGITFDPAIVQGARTEFETDQRAYRYALTYILDNPGTFIANGAKKLAHLFESEGGILVWTFHPDPEDSTTRYSQKYASLPTLIVLLTNLSYFTILIGGIIGLCAAERDKAWWLVTGILLLWLVIHGIVFGGSRFHFPLIPFLILYAARCIGELDRVRKSLVGSRKTVAFTLIIMLTALWIYEAFTILRA